MTEAYDITVLSLVFTFSILAVVANLLAVVIIARTPHLRVKYYALVYNVILADLGFALVCITYPWNVNNRSTIEDMLQIFSTVNALTVLAVAINRYLALSITPPSRYDALMTPFRLFIVCLVMWSFSIGITIPQMLSESDNSYDFIHAVVRSTLVILIGLVTPLVYLVVFRKVKGYAPPLADTHPLNPTSEQSVGATRYRQTRRLLVTFSLITAASLVCWLPANINIIVLYFKQDLLELTGFRVYYHVALFVYTLNTIVDPLIYWWRLEDFRDALCALCWCCRRSRSIDVETDVQVHNEMIQLI